ncbi:hypothetical protein OH76DRAFT_697155 [Lentinus brumalis]|uniref:Uncharacterized protein n=1 Tax=Lentinus brumalis TaxID=2498619 RepID=A0A371D6D0_9APHY|nr:hypothetical protein OH76DRAFT_697155 [Polyporus brumalis]
MRGGIAVSNTASLEVVDVPEPGATSWNMSPPSISNASLAMVCRISLSMNFVTSLTSDSGRGERCGAVRRRESSAQRLLPHRLTNFRRSGGLRRTLPAFFSRAIDPFRWRETASSCSAGSAYTLTSLKRSAEVPSEGRTDCEGERDGPGSRGEGLKTP